MVDMVLTNGINKLFLMTIVHVSITADLRSVLLRPPNIGQTVSHYSRRAYCSV